MFEKNWDGFVDESCRKQMPKAAACLYGELGKFIHRSCNQVVSRTYIVFCFHIYILNQVYTENRTRKIESTQNALKIELAKVKSGKNRLTICHNPVFMFSAITYLKTPIFVLSNFWDAYQMTQMVSMEYQPVNSPPLTKAERNFVSKFGNNTRRSLHRVRN